MNATARHLLVGLEPDNLLAFLALLGRLRALETARPQWGARGYWDDTRQPSAIRYRRPWRVPSR
jgi:hypothetical protein